ncbi:universal stress protein [Neptunomonas antarctica]|uniref:Nucleotide-binding universal stress protein, UspA family n=1 Tax=Neptunomonas antarctica TaxID=619304 RepID=A0A1N7PDZ7_9GAMM|nr:universal stress protein [Neptunomonas antarctica]SIT08794.1 Nucleotide-binding universal stress protein, UspA family [Neptunomonas antarctica]
MALPEINTILYTTSLGKHMRPVFRHTVKLAQALKAKIVILHVVEPIGEMGSALIKNYVSDDLIKKMHDEGINEIHQQMHARIEKFYEDELDNLSEKVDLDIEYALVEGNHIDSILKEAIDRNVHMIVMGAENTFGHHSHTTQKVVKHAKVPVVVVPTGKQYD